MRYVVDYIDGTTGMWATWYSTSLVAALLYARGRSLQPGTGFEAFVAQERPLPESRGPSIAHFRWGFRVR